jgi:large subunit ribosomal protein L10
VGEIMPKPDKIEAVEALKARFGAAKGIVLADFTGLTVAEANDLRRKCREAAVEYRVVKNTLAKIAAHETDLEVLEGFFMGPVAVALSTTDSIAPARVLAEFRKTVQKPVFIGGFLEGQVYAPEELRRIAVLPPREGLLAQVIGILQAPMGQIIWTLDGLMRNLVSILDQASKKAEGSS